MDNSSFDITLMRPLSTVGAAAYQDRLVKDVLRATWRRRWLVCLLAVFAIATAVTVLVMRPPGYSAEAIVRLEFNQREVNASGQEAPAVAVEASSIVQGEARIIHSPLIARQVVQRLNLGKELKPGRLQTLLDRFDNWLHRSTTGSTGETSNITTEQAAHTLFSNLRVTTDYRSYLITIGFTAERADTAARVANAVAEEYLRLRAQSVADTMRLIGDRLDTVLKEKTELLRDADAAVQQFRVRSEVLELGAGRESLEEQQLGLLSAELSVATRARIGDEERVVRATTLAADGNAASLDGEAPGLTQGKAERDAASRAVAELEARLGPHHPLVGAAQAKLADATAALKNAMVQQVSAAKAQAGAARRTEADLKSQVQALKHSIIVEAKGKEVDLHDLEGKAQGIRDEISALTHSYDQVLVMRDLRAVPASLVVPAQAMMAPASDAVVILVLALMGGLAAGIGLAVLLEGGDHGLRTSSEVREVTNLRCLGMVPELYDGTVRLLRRRTKSIAAFNEAVRTVGVAAGLFGRDGECQVVVVTSSLPGEGRSTMCRALARALLLADLRVMIVDGGPRRGDDQTVAARKSDTADASPGLPVSREGRYVVVERGTDVDVFGRSGLAQLISESRRQFDVILIEGPPVMLVGDSLVLGRLADRVIHVVRWASTKRRTLCAALQRLQENDVVVGGVVLARVNLARHTRLGFSDQCTYYEKETAFYERLSRNRGNVTALL